jgi:hypothetical protein
MTLPCRWADAGLPDFAGRVLFCRRFGYPGRIDTYERVWLTVAGVGDRADLALNGAALGRHEGGAGVQEWDVTAHLRPRNELVAEVEGGTERGGLWGEVALEVRREAFLRGVRVEPAGPGALRVTGEAVGEAPRPLELYVVVGRRPAAYGTVTPAAAGQPFALAAEFPAASAGGAGTVEVQVDLVEGATVWYTWGQGIAAPPAPSPGS